MGKNINGHSFKNTHKCPQSLKTNLTISNLREAQSSNHEILPISVTMVVFFKMIKEN